MTKAKKLVALMLAFLMIFSSVSVLASAMSDTVDSGVTLGITTKFFKEVDGVLTETTKVNPKETDTVTARVYLETDYFSGDSTLLFFYDKDFFTHSYAAAGQIALAVNPAATNGVTGYFVTNANLQSQVNAGYISADQLNEYGVFAVNLATNGTTVKHDGSDWLFEFELEVLDTAAGEGDLFTVEELYQSTSRTKALGDVPKGVEGGASEDTWSMWVWDANFDFESNPVSTISSVTFDANGGTFAGGAETFGPLEGTISEAIAEDALPANPSKEGYTFLGWVDAEIAEPTQDDIVAVPSFYPDDDLVLNAYWIKNVNIAFADTGDTTIDAITNVTPGTEFKEIADPTKAGYTFVGWDVRGGELPDVYPTADTTYTAVWATNVEVSFEMNGADPVGPFAGYDGAPFEEEIATPQKEGHYFVGWLLKGEEGKGLQSLPEVYPATDVTYTAVFDTYTYYVTYVVKNEKTGETQTYYLQAEYDAEIGFPKVQVPEGYEIDSQWYTDEDCTVPFAAGTKMGTAPVTLYTKITTVPYKAYFMLNEGDAEEDAFAVVDIIYGEEIAAPEEAPTKGGYNFSGWTPYVGIHDKESDVYFYATWVEKVGNVKYMANDGTDDVVEVYDIPYNYDLEIPADPAREGYTFLGWNTDADATSALAIEGTKMPEIAADGDEIVYYAVWQINTYKVTFDSNGGSAVDEKTQEYNSEVEAPADPTRAGYKFLGWTDADGDAVTFPFTMPADDVALTASWKQEEYTIRYVDTGDTAIADKVVVMGQTIDVPTGLTKEGEGLYFTGWDVTPPTEIGDMGNDGDVFEYTAQWAEESYTIIYKDTGDTAYENKVVKKGQTIEVPSDLTKEGQGLYFTGWDETPPTAIGDMGNNGDTFTYTAQWANESYTLKFANTGDTVIADKTVTYGDTIDATADPVWAGHVFAGWNETPPTAIGDLGNNGDVITYTADWTVETYVFHFTNTGDSAVEDATVTYGQDYTAPAGLTKYGYNFAGFEPEVPAKIEDMGEDKAEFTYAAQWTPKTIAVTFDANGGSFGEGTVTTVDSAFDGAINLPAAPTKAGYGFVGWSTDANASTGSMSLGNLTTETPATYYAIWSADSVNYTVEFWYQDVDGEGYTRDDSKTLTLPGVVDTLVSYTAAATETGFELNAEESTLEGTVPAEGTLVLSAYYDRVEYTLTYEGNEPVKVYFDAEIPAAAVTPEKEGNYFVKWQNELTKMPASDLSIAAEWALEEYTIVFADTGDMSYDDQKVNMGEAINVPTDLAKSGAGVYFTGWDEEIPAVAPDMGAHGEVITYTAQWANETYVLTFTNLYDNVVEDMTVEYGTDATLPAGLTREGYDFLGWKDVTNDVNVASPWYIEDLGEKGEVITLEARWSIQRFTVTFDADGGTFTGTNPVTQAYNTQVSEPSAPVKTGYDFSHWINVKDDSKVTFPFVVPAENTTLKAVYTPKTYVIRYADTGDVTIADVPVTFGDTIVTPTDLTKNGSGYYFTGWDETPPTTIGDMGATGTVFTYTAQWDKESYTLTFADTGDTTVADMPVTYGDTITVPSGLTKEGQGVYFTGFAPELTATIGDLGDNGATVEYTAQWANETYTLTFTNLYDNTVEDMPVTYGDTITVPAGLTRYGYEFTGWNPELSATIGDLGANEATVSYEAQWTAKTIGVTFDGNEGTIDGAATKVVPTTFDGAITAPTAVREGYSFIGWSTDPDATTGVTNLGNLTTEAPATYYAIWSADAKTYTVEFYEMNVDGNGYTKLEKTETLNGTVGKETAEYVPTVPTGFALNTEASVLKGTVPATGELVLKVYFDRNKYTLTYDGAESFEVYFGTAAADMPATDIVPTKEGHVFASWQALPATMPATAYNVAADWTKEVYTLIFADTNDAGDAITMSGVEFGSTITAPTGLTKTGHVFTGWDQTPPTTVGDLGANGAEVTYTAQWTKETYTLTFTNLYDNTVEDMPVTYGDTITVPAGLTRYGFDFTGWAPELTATIGDLGADKATVSYAAQWTEKTINVTFDGNEGTIEGAATKDVPTTFNGAITAPTELVRDGYTFAGWSTDKNAEIGTHNLGNLTTETPDTYYAIWTANGAEYKVEFWYMDLDGVNYTKADADATLNGVVDETATYAPAAKEGFTVNNEKSVLSGTVPATGTLTLKVYYDRQQYNLIYLDATGAAFATYPVYFGTAAAEMPVPAEAPEKVGNYFNGWNTLPATMPAAEQKIAPKFAKESYTLTFAETGKTVIDDIPVTYGDIIDEVAVPEKDGYKFLNWNPEVPTEIGDLGNNGDTITYTAEWKLEEYNLVFADTNDAGDAITMNNVAYGSTIVVPSGLTKTGYVFAGWDETPAETIGDLGDDGATITYTAQWTKETYTLIFADTNDAGEAITKVVTYGDTIEAPAGLTKTGYYFTGWDETPPTVIEDMGDDKATFTYNAQWTVETYVFHFTNTSDSAVEDATVTYGQDYTAPTGLTKYGYNFAGFEPEVPAKIEDMGEDKAEFTYAAQWTPKTIAVTFDANGGSFGEGTVTTVDSAFDGAINLPAAPTKAGYGFVGWSTDANASTGSMSLGNLTTETPATYYAIWSADSVNYTVEFWYQDVDGEGYTRDDSKTLTLPGVVDTLVSYTAAATETGFELNAEESTLEGTVPAEGTLVLSAYYDRVEYTLTYEGNEPVKVYFDAEIPAAAVTPEKEGNYFVKWQNELTKMPASDLSIAAEWALEEYTITFTDLYGNAVENITAKYGDEITVPAGLTREGYVFTGWKNAAGEALTTPVGDIGNNGDTVAYAAQWALDQFTITIKLDGGNVDGKTDDIVITQDYGTDVEKPANPVKTGYTFVDWNVTIPSTMPAEDMTVTAIWKAESYTVVFADTNDAGDNITLPVTYGATITIPEGLTKTGYVFTGWDETPSANIGDLGEDGATVTYTAQWAKEAYTLIFADTNDAGDAITMSNVEFGSTIEAPAGLTKTGHVFSGWDKTPPTTIGDLGANGATVTYTAQWTKETYTLKFANTGDTVIADKVVTYGDTIEAVADPEWAGYKFTGWDVTPPTTIGDLGDNEEVITYTAKWDNDTFKVTWIDESGSTTVDVVYGDAIEVPEAAEKEGYYFVMWTPDVPETMPAENLEFTALYEVRVYYVSFYVNGKYFSGYGAEYGDEIRTEGIGYTVPLGYEFDGWYTDPECTEKFVSGTVGAESINLYAKETVGTYTANFYLDDAKTELHYTVDVQFDKEIRIPEELATPTKVGYTFAGWDPIVGIMDAEGKDFVAIWNEDDTIVVTYYVDGEVYESFDNQTFGDEYDIPADPYKKGHKFEGWAFKGTTDIVDVRTLSVAAEGAEFDAIFTVTAFEVNYFVYEESEHGPAGTPAPGYVTYVDAEGNAVTGNYGLGDAIAHPAAPEIEFYTFAGWFDAEGNEWVEGAAMPANEVNLYAKYERVAVQLVAQEGSTTVVTRGSDKTGYTDFFLTGFALRPSLTQSVLESTYVDIVGDGSISVKPVGSNRNLGTGAVVTLTDNVTGEVAEQFYVVIYGDLDGNGRINGADSNILVGEIANPVWSVRNSPNRVEYLVKAADLDGNRRINGADSNILIGVVAVKYTIDQQTGKAS